MDSRNSIALNNAYMTPRKNILKRELSNKHDLRISATPVAGQQQQKQAQLWTLLQNVSDNPQVNTPTASQSVPPAVVCGLNSGHKVKVLSSIRQFSPNAEGGACNNSKIRPTLLQQLQERNRRDPQTDDTNLALHDPSYY